MTRMTHTTMPTTFNLDSRRQILRFSDAGGDTSVSLGEMGEQGTDRTASETSRRATPSPRRPSAESQVSLAVPSACSLRGTRMSRELAGHMKRAHTDLIMHDPFNIVHLFLDRKHLDRGRVRIILLQQFIQTERMHPSAYHPLHGKRFKLGV